MSKLKLDFQQITTLISVIVVVFGASGLGLFKLNKMVTQEEFDRYKIEQQEKFNRESCKDIRQARISEERKRVLFLLKRNDTLQYYKLQDFLVGELVEMNAFIDDRKLEYQENGCALLN